MVDKTYAYVRDGKVAQIVPIMGAALESRGLPVDYVAALVEITGAVPAIGDIASFDGGVWSFAPAPLAGDSVEMARAAQANALRAAAAAQIVAGFASDALGAAHTYPFKATDQANLLRLATSSLAAGEGWTGALWCADAADTWARRDHTAAQIRTVAASADAHVAACQAQLEALLAAVTAAATVDAVHAIVWAAP